MISVALFNHKGGVGKTALAYHLAWMFSSRGVRTLVADLDPQSNLSGMFLDEDRLEMLWPEGDHPATILGAVQPILEGTGDVRDVHVEAIDPPFGELGLLVGDLGLSAFEAKLSEAWPRTLDRHADALRVTTAFHRMIQRAGETFEAGIVILDVGPNLGALNRAALLAADHVVVPLVPDLFSLQGLRNLGPTLRAWRGEWSSRLERNPTTKLALPQNPVRPAGYIVQQLSRRRQGVPPEAYRHWARRIPQEYRRYVLGEDTREVPALYDDPHCLAQLKHYRSLMLFAMEARKPIFELKAADGAIGAHAQAVTDCRRDFRHLASEIADRCGVSGL